MRILIIDEDRPSHFLKASLEAEYFAVDLAPTHKEGVHYASINEYDLIVLDTGSSEQSGIDVCRTLRTEGRMMPILTLLVNDDSASKVRFLNAGADDCLTKPFALEECTARVRALIRRAPTLESDVMTISNLTLDSKACTVTRGKKRLSLTRKEFMLLHYLMRNEGSVLSRGLILEHVWDMRVDIFSNTIESHVVSLRKKLGECDKNRLIHTIPGRGYKLEA